MNILRSPIGNHEDDLDARDSDLQSLPDASDASRWNAPMLLVVACVVTVIASLLAVVLP